MATIPQDIESRASATSSTRESDTALRLLLELVRSDIPAQKFYREALHRIAAIMGSAFATLQVRLGEEVIEHEFEGASKKAAVWRPNVQEFLAQTLTDGRPKARLHQSAPPNAEVAFLGVTLADAAGRSVGALALVIPCRDAEDAREQLTFLNCLSMVCSTCQTDVPVQRVQPRASPQPSPSPQPSSDARIPDPLARFGSPMELAVEITDKIQSLQELARAGMPAPDFYREALHQIGATMATPFATLQVRLGGEVIEHEFEGASKNTAFWRRNVQEFLTQTLTDGEPTARLYHSARLKTEIAFLGVMLADAGGGNVGALALVVSCRGSEDAREQLAFLNCLSLVCSTYQANATIHHAEPSASPEKNTDARVASHLARFGSPMELAFEVTNKIRARTSSAQVALGRVRGKSVRLMSISGLDDLKKRSPQVIRLQAAMEECLDHGAPIVRQEVADGSQEPAVFLLHEAWRRETGDACVASIPIQGENGPVGVLSLRRGESNPFNPEELEELGGLVGPYIVGMDFVAQANRGLMRHALAATTEGAIGWLRPGKWLRKGIYAGIAALCLFTALGTLPHTVSVPSVLVPGTVFNASAPFSAVLREAPAVSGDKVEEGDLLCRLDTTELELDKTRRERDLEVLRVRQQAALANDSAVDTALLEAQIRQVRAQLEILARDLARSSVFAPFDGIVLTGDLRDRVGDQIIQGEPLFQVSPEKNWTLELEVPESQITYLDLGLEGRFASRARPEEPYDFVIRRIRPSAEQRDGTTVYVVEADIAFQLDWLLAGMEGLARVEAGERPVWWLMSHGVLDRMRLNFWL